MVIYSLFTKLKATTFLCPATRADQKHPVGAPIRVRGEDRRKTVSLTLHSSHFSSTTS